MGKERRGRGAPAPSLAPLCTPPSAPPLSTPVSSLPFNSLSFLDSNQSRHEPTPIRSNERKKLTRKEGVSERQSIWVFSLHYSSLEQMHCAQRKRIRFIRNAKKKKMTMNMIGWGCSGPAKRFFVRNTAAALVGAVSLFRFDKIKLDS